MEYFMSELQDFEVELLYENLKYADGYIDPNTFQWETVANVTDAELTKLKNSIIFFLTFNF